MNVGYVFLTESCCSVNPNTVWDILTRFIISDLSLDFHRLHYEINAL